MWQFLAIKQNWIIQLAICHIWYIPTTLLWFLNQWWQFVVTFWGYNDHHMRIWGSYIFRDCPIIPGQFDDYSHMRVWGYEDPHMRIWIIMVQNFQGLPHHTRTIRWWSSYEIMRILILGSSYEGMRIWWSQYEDMNYHGSKCSGLAPSYQDNLMIWFDDYPHIWGYEDPHMRIWGYDDPHMRI